jgi:uncharacterized circularly permuted ATP-grasp superfamily protein
MGRVQGVAPPYEEVPGSASLSAIRRDGAARVRARVEARLERAGVHFRSEDGSTDVPLDPVPRVIGADDWHELKIGLAQRVKALNAFVADAYGPRRIVQAGVVPPRVIESADNYEPAMRGVEPPGGLWIGIAGLDVVRDASGAFLVLEDNLMTPSGFGYAVAAREAVLPALDPEPDARPRSVAGAGSLLAGTMAAVAAADAPHVVVVTDGDSNSAHWEHAWAARELGVALVEPGDLRVDGDRLLHGSQRVDAVYRRTDADRVDSPVGALLAGPVQAGTLGMVNAFGTGVGDDKLTHAYVEDIVRFYLGEEPAIASVQTLDLARPDHLELALDTLDDLVVKPRAGQGGDGVVVCPHAEPADVERVRETIRAAPRDWIAQPFVPLSTHLTLVDDELAPRHVDLRPYVFMHGADHPRVLPGGLTRFAVDEGAMVVNSTQNGGIKDTWVLA